MQDELENVGIKYLHYSLLKENYNSYLLYLSELIPSNNVHLNSIKHFVSESSPKIIGISLLSTDFKTAVSLTEYLKSHFKDTIIVWGGTHPTIAPESCLDYADYVCVGEGESAILDMAKAVYADKSLNDINSLCYKNNRRIVKNPLSPLINDLDALPIYDHIPKSSYIFASSKILPIDKKLFKRFARHSGTVYNILSSRGCPFSCTYCCNNAITKLNGTRKIRKRGIKNIIAELSKAVKDNPEIKSIAFQDDCFLVNSKANINDFCQKYSKEIKKPFMVRSIPIYVTQEKIELLKVAGLSWVNIGLQSGSDRLVRDIYKRKSLKKDFLQAAMIIRGNNIAGFYDIITDNPYETDSDRLETINTLIETPKPFYPQIFSLILYNGTELYEMVNKSFPEKEQEYFNKNYLFYGNTIHNDMIRMAGYLDRRLMALILNMYMRSPKTLQFKIVFNVLKLTSLLVLEPITYMKLIIMTQNGSYLKALIVIPTYFREGFKRYIKQFK